MNRYPRIACLLLAAAVFLLLSMTGRDLMAWSGSASLTELCSAFNALNTKIRDGSVNRNQAQRELALLVGQIRHEYAAAGGQNYPVAAWVFPLKGYGPGDIGGVHGSGYQPGGYDYFDGNRHTGHPSHDIFIHDVQQTGLDDATMLPVSVLSVTGGVVVALEREWQPGSPLRGGQYIWILDPAANVLLYYAHNSRILVSVGEMVRPGDVIGEVGRTGRNAHAKRSPTHLHLTCLQVDADRPVPKDIYRELLASQVR